MVARTSLLESVGADADADVAKAAVLQGKDMAAVEKDMAVFSRSLAPS